MPLHPGDRLGPYEILSPIGAGGMGEVYKARDTRLEREVAVKVLQEHLDSDPFALPRFEREAKAVAALSHPNILAIHDFGREGGVPYAVMELLEGRTLAEVLKSGPLPVADVLEIALQVAKGLAAAHDKGIVHRDLKPGNIFITKDDQVKILDFGLARLPAKRGAGAGLVSERVTLDTPTQDGTILGTVDYMAPEQARGEHVDARSDVFAFGVVLYEMSTGRSPFDRGSVAETLAALLREDPLPLPPSLPPPLGQLVLRCLQKRPEERFSSAHELVLALRGLGGTGEGATLPQRAGGGPQASGLSVLAVALVLAPALLWWPLSLLRPVKAVEDWLVDARFLFAKSRPPDPRIVLVSLDEPSLAADPSPIMERADEFGAALTKIFDQGPAGVAVDLLLPEKWGESQSFTRMITDNSKKLVLAAYSTPEGAVLGPECLKGPVTLSLGPESAAELFGFVNITRDADGAVRRERRAFLDREGKPRGTLPAKAAELIQGGVQRTVSDRKPFLIDFSVDPARLQRVSWKDLPAVLGQGEAFFRGKLVLVGAEYAASGDVSYRVPHRRGGKDEVSGLVLNALSANTLLEGARIRDAQGFAAAVLLGLALVLAGFGSLGRPRSVVWWAVCLALWGLYFISSIVVSRELGIFLPLAGPGAACLLSAGGMLWVGRMAGS